MSIETAQSSIVSKWTRILAAIGPGLMLAAATIGPGSVTDASVIGSKYGYALLWSVVIAIVLRGLYSRAFYSSSLVLKAPAQELVRRYYGPSWGVLSGILCVLGSVAFQVGNFTGTGMGLSMLYPGISWKVYGGLMTLVTIWLLYSKDVYRRMEQFMKVCVFVMVAVFLGSLILAGGPSIGAVASGLVPKFPDAGAPLFALSMFATSLSVTGVAYGTYLGREKRWTLDDLKSGMINWDICVSVGVIGLITLLIMFTAAAVLFPRNIVIKSTQEMVAQLVPLIGPSAKYLFGIGLFAAAISSMIMNCQVGATLFLSGLGKASEMRNKTVRMAASIILLIGCCMGLLLGKSPVQLLISANAASIINAPLLGIVAILLCNRKEMGEFKASKQLTVGLVISYIAILTITASNFNKLLGSLGLK